MPALEPPCPLRIQGDRFQATGVASWAVSFIREELLMAKERPRLLVVDDDSVIAATFEAILRSEGYDVATAQDGKEALEFVRQAPFDLVLLDLLLPDMDGWTVLQHLREISPNSQVVILCADVDAEGTIEAFRLGAVDVFLKPPDVDKLLRFVDDLTRPRGG
jgi:two-component system OmpR family response regulator